MSKDTLIIIKPDALSMGLAGKIIAELEKEELKLCGARLVQLTKERAKEFYREHSNKDFYGPLVDFMSVNPIFVMVWAGENVIKRSRKIIGDTDPRDAKEGTIRKKWAQDYRHNIIHGSDSPSSAAREIEFFFPSGRGIYRWKKKEFKL
ncbi:MAG: nucleoside-diphosphate kinase [Elusimicrobiota bacterium]|nr:nucleoside-diphosphate kinase [Elusimicrobiota bacterium]